MKLEKQFQVELAPEDASTRVCQDDTLLTLFPEAEVSIVGREGSRRTVATRYTALGRQGTATFHFDFAADGRVRFEKVCDGNVWRELTGSVSFSPRRGGTRVTIRTEGRTKAFVPEIAIRGAMRDQVDQMAEALRERIESGS